MKIADFFLYVLTKTEAWRELRWINSVYAIMDDEIDQPYSIVRRKDGFYYNDPTNGYVKIDDITDTTIAPIHPLLNVEIPAGAWDGVGNESVKTVYGNALVMRIIHSESGDRFPFLLGELSPKKLESEIVRLIKDDDEFKEDPTLEKTYIPASKIPKLLNNIFSMTSLSQLCVPSLSEKLMLPPPGIEKYKKELFEQYKDKLDDPATIAKINGMLMVKLKEWLKDDSSNGFTIKSKSINVAQAKKVLMFGAVDAFHKDGKVDLIKNSLYEGIDFKEFHIMQNSARVGSYRRGAETALGGEWTKYVYRMMQDTKILDEDCGSTKTKKVILENSDLDFYNGLYYMEGEKPKVITTASTQLTGKVLEIRTPMWCKSAAPHYCGICAGDAMRERPEGAAEATTQTGATYMGLSMSAMHGKELKTNRLLSHHLS